MDISIAKQSGDEGAAEAEKRTILDIRARSASRRPEPGEPERRVDMRVKDILRAKSARLITILQDASMQEAAELIFSERVGVLLVVDNRRELVGQLSARDVICFVALKGAEALLLPVGACMSDAW